MQIEAAKSNTALPRFVFLGVPQSKAKASKERVLTACHQAGIFFPHSKVTLNFQSSQTIRDTTSLEFAIAVSLLQLYDFIPKQKYCVLGKIDLNGQVLPSSGIYPGLALLKEWGAKEIWTPTLEWPQEEAKGWSQILHPVKDIATFLAMMTGKQAHPELQVHQRPSLEPNWRQLPHRISLSLVSCLELILAGGHHALLLGPPGIGKTHARIVLETLLPPLSPAEALSRQLTLSVTEWEPEKERVLSPSSSVTRSQLMGGKRQMGVLSQLQYGILFLDELPNFRKECLQALQPYLETDQEQPGMIVKPGSFTCVATSNPCPCGFYGSARCQCSESEVKNYYSRFTGAMRDRFDITWRVTDLDARTYSKEEWKVMYQRIIQARERQRQRRKQGWPVSAHQYAWEHLLELAPSGLRKRWEKEKRHISWRKLLQQARLACTLADLQQEALDESWYELAGLYTSA